MSFEIHTFHVSHEQVIQCNFRKFQWLEVNLSWVKEIFLKAMIFPQKRSTGCNNQLCANMDLNQPRLILIQLTVKSLAAFKKLFPVSFLMENVPKNDTVYQHVRNTRMEKKTAVLISQGLSYKVCLHQQSVATLQAHMRFVYT